MSQDSEEWGRQLYEVTERIRALAGKYERAYASNPLPGSVRAADDLASGSLAIGQYVQYCLAQAVDACEGIRKLVTNERGLEIPLSATYPLSRTAIESSSMALWVMRPATRRERVLRRLRIAQDELKYEKAFAASVSLTQCGSEREATKRAHAQDAQRIKLQMSEIAKASSGLLHE